MIVCLSVCLVWFASWLVSLVWFDLFVGSYLCVCVCVCVCVLFVCFLFVSVAFFQYHTSSDDDPVWWNCRKLRYLQCQTMYSSFEVV